MAAREGRPSEAHLVGRCSVLGRLLLVFFSAILVVAGILLGLVPVVAASTAPPTSTSDSAYDCCAKVAQTLAADGLRHEVAVTDREESGLLREAAFGVPSRFANAANTGTALVKYDADFAVGQLTAGGRATASQLDEFGAAQGWARSQTATGPVKYTDGNGVVRLTIKQGSPRTPGSGGPHVELRNPGGTRIDPFGNPVSRTSPGNHTPIVWDW